MRPIFCGNFEYDARQSDVERLFSKYGRVDRVDMKQGFAFIYMDDERDAEDAIRGLDRREFGIQGRRLRVEWTKQERGGRRSVSSRRSSANIRPSKTLFVINFDPINTRTRDLERHFEPYGKVLNVRIRRNFSFIQFESQEDATKALEATNMSKLLDRVITVEYAVRDDDDDSRRNGPDRRGRDYSPDRRGRNRGRSTSPCGGGRERGSPDYGRGSALIINLIKVLCTIDIAVGHHKEGNDVMVADGEKVTLRRRSILTGRLVASTFSTMPHEAEIGQNHNSVTFFLTKLGFPAHQQLGFYFWYPPVAVLFLPKFAAIKKGVMYGGDEVSAIVIDLGSHTCKAGYAGEDAPKAVFPSVAGSIEQLEAVDDIKSEKENESLSDSKSNLKAIDSEKAKVKRKLYVGSQALGFRRDHMEVISPFKDGVVVDWDIVDNIWVHAFKERLLIDPKEHPMLLAEPTSNSPQQRERAAELMFENYKVPALFVAKNAVLTSFASGRATSLVVDSGGGSTTVAPVHDGYVLQKGVATSPIGGEFLTECMLKSLESKGIILKPRYSFKRKEVRPGDFQTMDLDFPNTTESYRLYSQRLIASDIKECVCRAPDTPYDESAYANIPMTPYELPDGQIIEIGADRFKVPDVLFNPSLVQTFPGLEIVVDSAPVRGLPQMVLDSINKCDVDIRRELFSSILLSGGTASMQQLKERLEKDLMEEAPQAARVKVLASGNSTERRFSVWIGGSILASLGSFQQMWFSKGEYEEHGASYIQRKCP